MHPPNRQPYFLGLGGGSWGGGGGVGLPGPLVGSPPRPPLCSDMTGSPFLPLTDTLTGAQLLI